MAEKNVNYTDEMVARLHEVYGSAETEADRDTAIRSLAEEFGKNVASVRAKLTREGIYVKKEKTTKTGAKVETKEAIVSDIARILGVDADASLSGLEKATKNCLILLRGTMAAVTSEE